jgi:hypothetical protein
LCAPRRGASTTCGYHIRMTGGTRRRMRLVWAGVLLAYFPSSGCSPARPPIALSEGTVIVQNQTKQEWRKVVVTVNDHFRAGAASLAPGGRLLAPLNQFQTAFGQHFDRGRQSVAKIELSATDGDGKPVSLKWTGGRVN